MSNIQKYNFRLISNPVSISSNTQQLTYADYYLPLHLSLTTKNIGYYQYVSQELNDSLPLITGQTLEFTLYDNTYKLPDEPDLSFNSYPSLIISGYSSSELITSIKGYNSISPYKVGSKVIDGTTINILEVTPFYVKYTIDLINYITYFNINIYSSVFATSIVSNNRFIFDSITTEDNYILSIKLDGTQHETPFYVFKNNKPLIPMVLTAGKQIVSTKLKLEYNDFIEILMSGQTTSATLEYKLIPEEIDNEERYTTLYFFGSNTLNTKNSLSTGFIYKSDIQHYDEKPIVYNKIDVERNGISVYDSIFKLGSIGNVNDFEEFFVV